MPVLAYAGHGMYERPTHVAATTPTVGREAAILKALGHPTRLRLLEALSFGEECACHPTCLLGRPQPYVSRQLAALRETGLLADRRDAQRVFYRLSGPEVARLLAAVPGLSGRPASAARPNPPGCPCPRCR